MLNEKQYKDENKTIKFKSFGYFSGFSAIVAFIRMVFLII